MFTYLNLKRFGTQQFKFAFNIFVLTIFAAIFLNGCGGGSSSSMGGDDLKSKITISGVLTDSDGNPLNGAKVGLASGPFEAISAPDGSFSFETNSIQGSSKDIDLLIQGTNYSALLKIPSVPAAAKELALRATVNKSSGQAMLDSLNVRTNTPSNTPPEPTALPTSDATQAATPDSAGDNNQADPTPRATSTPRATPTQTEVSPTPEPTIPAPTPTAIVDPLSPTNVHAQIPNSNADISWSNPDPSVTSFVIYRASAKSGPFSAISEISSSAQSFRDLYSTDKVESLYYRISAKIGAVESVASSAVLAPPMADLNHDGCVDSADQAILTNSLNNPQSYDPNSDFNQDGSVTLADAVIFTAWMGWCAQ